MSFRNLESPIAHWLEHLQHYADFKVKHRAGKVHRNVDALSRCPCVERSVIIAGR